MSNFTMRNAHTNHLAKHDPRSSTLTKSRKPHPNQRKEDITYFPKNHVLTLGSITLFPFVVNSFDKDSYLECSILQEYLDLLEEHKIEFDKKMQEKFKNETYTLSELLFGETEELDGEVFDYRKITEKRNEKIRDFFRESTQADYVKFINRCIEINNSGFLKNRDEYRFFESLFEVFRALIDRDPVLGLKVFIDYLDLNDPLTINPISFIAIFESKLEDYTLLLSIIQNSNLDAKIKWLFGYFFNLPKDSITEEDVSLLLSLYQEANPEYIPYHTDYLLKYTVINEEIIVIVTSIMLEHISRNMQFARALEIMFNPHTEINKNLEMLFKEDTDLLKRAYLAVLEYSHYADYDGSNLDKILKLDSKFMLEIVKRYEDLKHRRYRDDNDYSCVWLHEEYQGIMDDVVRTIFEYENKRYSYREPLLEALFLNKEENALVIERQNSFLKKIIHKFSSNIELMQMIFLVVSHFSASRRLSLLQEFLTHNKEYRYFKKLPLEESLQSWSGSEVPLLQQRIAFFESVLGLLNSVDLLEHKHWIEGFISYLRDRIEQEKKSDFLDD